MSTVDTKRVSNEFSIRISSSLCAWYNQNKRDLPWRHTKDPYKIWLSEIILQQTRVIQGLSYYHRFIKQFPTVKSLAEADEDDILRLWQGLGYYSRARNMKQAALSVEEDFSGCFPHTYKEIHTLKGIGDYTAAAIASFAFDLPYAVLDGNVYRVIARLLALDTPIDSTEGKKLFQKWANELLDTKQPALHNQAIMELGALCCTPKNPTCDRCPLLSMCAAYDLKKVESLPIKKNKTKTRDRYFNYFHILYKGSFFLHQRGPKDIWQGLYELPMIETSKAQPFHKLENEKAFKKLFPSPEGLLFKTDQKDIKHVLSHQILHANFFTVQVEKRPPALKDYEQVTPANLSRFAIPRLIEIYFEKMNGILF